jgi:hypothetical protein
MSIYIPDEFEKPLLEIVSVFWADWQDKVLETFDEGGGSFIHAPFLDSHSGITDPLALRVSVLIPSVLDDHGKGDKERYSAPVNLRDELMELISEDPDHFRDKALQMVAAFRALADEIELTVASGVAK